jgi:hypothetical protein
MNTYRFSEERITGFLKQAQADLPVRYYGSFATSISTSLRRRNQRAKGEL